MQVQVPLYGHLHISFNTGEDSLCKIKQNDPHVLIVFPVTVPVAGQLWPQWQDTDEWSLGFHHELPDAVDCFWTCPDS